MQIWKYYGIFGFLPNERGRIHEHKAQFRKQLSVQAFDQSMWETRSESAHGHYLVGFVFKRATHSIRCSSAGLSNSVALLRATPSGLGVNCLYALWGLMHRTKMSVPWRFSVNTCTVYIYTHIQPHTQKIASTIKKISIEWLKWYKHNIFLHECTHL